jgi:hypothetical protein
VKKGGVGGRVAIVGFGPSLQETWKEIAGFDAIWTTSKAHDFLFDREIIPTHHTDIDYREHKAQFNKMLGGSTKYLLATQVHPTYLDRLRHADVSLFHSEQLYGGLYPPPYLRQPGLYDAGLQAARLAFELGYREQAWFGMDASARAGVFHAGPHEGTKQDIVEFEVAGAPRQLSMFLIRQALCAEKLLCKLPHLRVKIHGDGALRPLLQERGKCRVD